MALGAMTTATESAVIRMPSGTFSVQVMYGSLICCVHCRRLEDEAASLAIAIGLVCGVHSITTSDAHWLAWQMQQAPY